MISPINRIRPRAAPLADGTMLPICSVVLECGHDAIADLSAKVGDSLPCLACRAAKRLAGKMTAPPGTLRWWLSKIRSLC